MHKKPKGTGYVESSIEDRYASMSVPTDLSNLKRHSPDDTPRMAIGRKAAKCLGRKKGGKSRGGKGY